MNTTNQTLAVTGYDPDIKFYASRYKQGGRTVYSLDLSLAQIASLIPSPDPTAVQPGNRRINLTHAQGFAKYFREHTDWVSPALVLRGSQIFEFEAHEEVAGTEFGVVAFPRLAMSDLRILDGQHRILGIHTAMQGIASDLDKARSQLAMARKNGEDAVVAESTKRVEALSAQRKRMESERLSLQIFVEESLEAAEQMFFDITDNALGITASVKTRFDSRKIVNRVLQGILLHPLLMDRVDLEADRIGPTNLNLLGAKHVAEIVRTLAVGLEGVIRKRQEAELDETELLVESNQFFDALMEFKQLKAVAEGKIEPKDMRAASQLGSTVTLRVLAGVYFELRKEGMDQGKIIRFFKKLDKHLSRPATADWVKRIGNDIYQEGWVGPRSRRQDLKVLRDVLVSWAHEMPEWL